MIRQEFDTTDVVRLELGRPTLSVDGLRNNLLKNSRGERGTWGWKTTAARLQLQTIAPGGSPDGTGLHAFDADPGTTAQFPDLTLQAEYEPAVPGRWYAGGFTLLEALPANTELRIQVQFRRADLIGAASETDSFKGVTTITTSSAVGQTYKTPAVKAPSDAAYAHFIIALRRLTVGSTTRRVKLDNAFLVERATEAQALAGVWSATLEWTNILANSHQVTIERPGDLQPGLLKATVLDATLDPADSDLVRPNTDVRVLAKSHDTGAWEPLFWGALQNGSVRYDLTHPNEAKRARVEISGTDATRPLAGSPETRGVASVGELAPLMEGRSIPWLLDGDHGQTIATATTRSLDDNGSLLSQIGLVQNTLLAAAFVDRWNRLVVMGRTYLAGRPTQATLDEPHYLADALIDYDTARLVNEVRIKELTLDADGKTVEVDSGSFTDIASIAEWGRYSVDYVRNFGSAMSAPAHAAIVLGENAQPRRAVREVAFHVTSSLSHLRTAGGLRRAFLDRGDKVRVINSRAGLDSELRVHSVKHEISPKRWRVSLGFDAAAGAPLPALTGAPVVDSRSLSVNELNLFHTNGYTGFSRLVRRGNGVDIYLDAKAPAGGMPGGAEVILIPPEHRPLLTGMLYFYATDVATGNPCLTYYNPANGYIHHTFAREANAGSLGHIHWNAKD